MSGNWTDDVPPFADDPPFEEERPMPPQNQQQPRGNNRKPYVHKTNRGSMFENDQKTKDQQPDFTGSVDVNGTIYWISAWKDMTQAGKKKLSLSVKLQEERPQQQQRQQGQPQQRRTASW